MPDPITVDITLTGTLSPNCYPTKPQDYLDAIANLMTATLPGGSAFTLGPPGSTTPPADTTQAWLKLNPDGSIIGWYTYVNNVTATGGAAWVRPYPIGTDFHQHWLWSGADGANDLWLFDGGDGTDPSVPANVGPAWGSFWKVDTAFDYRMALGPDPGDATATPPVLPIDVGDTDGSDGYVISESNMVPHSHQIPILFNDSYAGAATLGNFWLTPLNKSPIGNVRNPALSPSAPSPYNWPWCQGSTETTFGPDLYSDNYMLNTGSWGSGSSGAKINTLSPYKAIYFIQRTARKYILG